MKHIKIFLASSIKEFDEERISLKNFVRQMENVLIDHDVYLKMFICEYADNSIADGRKQDEFSREIDDSDIFLILTGRRLGEYTLEEYHYALDIFQKRGGGKVLACFKTGIESEQSAKDFSQNLSPDAVRAEFADAAEIKAALVTTIGAMLGPEIPIQVENEKALIAGKAIKL